jgi:hypothetical protein
MTSRGIGRSVFLAYLLSATPCQATPVSLDQFYVPTLVPHNGLLAEDSQTVAQTFTVGVGGRLTAIELELGCCLSGTGTTTFPVDDLLIEIRTSLSDGSPSDHVLATTTASSRTLAVGTFAFERFSLAHSEFPVRPGERYAIVLSSLAPPLGGLNPYAWGGDGIGQYDRGSVYVARPSTGGEFFLTSFDMGFRTFVNPVPEPASFTLVALAAAAAMARARIVRYRQARKLSGRAGAHAEQSS